MPKDKSSRALASQKSRYKPYSNHGKGLEVIEGDTSEGHTGRRDWEDATCPICMDFPHNAVLLLCTSHDKGCRPYICNTSYRHSNCLDQYKKAHAGTLKAHGNVSVEAVDLRILPRSHTMDTNTVRTTRRSGMNFTVSAADGADDVIGVQSSDSTAVIEGNEAMEESVMSEHSGGSSSFIKADAKDLVCPLCRGEVNGWLVVDAAREHLNYKARNCAQEACLFTGTYEELRIHARCEHPMARPSEIDPARLRDWRRLECQRDFGDVLSSIRSALPGATVLGDYVIEDDMDNDNDDMDFPGDDGHWWTVFLLFQVFGPAASIAGRRGMSPRVRGHPRGQRRRGTTRLGLWGSLHRSGPPEADSSPGSSDAGEQASGSWQRQRSHNRSQGDVDCFPDL